MGLPTEIGQLFIDVTSENFVTPEYLSSHANLA